MPFNVNNARKMIASGDLTEIELFDILDEEGMLFEDMEGIFAEIRSPEKKQREISTEEESLRGIGAGFLGGVSNLMNTFLSMSQDPEMGPEDFIQPDISPEEREQQLANVPGIRADVRESIAAPTIRPIENLAETLMEGTGKSGEVLRSLTRGGVSAAPFLATGAPALPILAGGAGAGLGGDVGSFAGESIEEALDIPEQYKGFISTPASLLGSIIGGGIGGSFGAGSAAGAAEETLEEAVSARGRSPGDGPPPGGVGGDLLEAPVEVPTKKELTKGKKLKGKRLGKGDAPKVAAEKARIAAEKADITPLTTRELKSRINNAGKNLVEDFKTKLKSIPETDVQAKEIFPDTKTPKQLMESVVDAEKKSLVDRIAPVKDRQTEWTGLQSKVNKKFDVRKESYGKDYGKARAAGAKVDPTKAQDSLIDTVKSYGNTASVPKAHQQKLAELWKDFKLPGDWKDVFKKEGVKNLGAARAKVNASDLMNTMIHTSDYVNYSEFGTDSKRLFGPVITAGKEDLRGIGGTFGKHYSAAEAKYAETAKIYGKDSVKAFRRAESPETHGARFTDGSKYENLVKALDSDPEAIRQLEANSARDILGKSSKAATKHLEAIQKHVSPESVENIKLGIDVDKNTTSLDRAGERRILQDMDDVRRGIKQPTRVINMIENGGAGNDLVKRTLKGVKGGDKLYKALARDSAEKTAKTFTKGDVIDFKEAKIALSDPNKRAVFVEAFGEEGTVFIETLEENAARVEKGFEQIELRKESGKITYPTKKKVDSVLKKSGKAALVFGKNALPLPVRATIDIVKAVKNK